MKLSIRIGPKPSDSLNRALPSAVLSQLGNVAETLTVHPDRPRTLALVSSSRGEGTSTCTVNLGKYLANRHARVLMVDANVHHPALHEMGNVRQSPGVLELLLGRHALDEVVQATGLEGLFVVPSGEREPFSSNGQVVPSAFRDRILAAAKAFDYVLVDCPPVNVYEDSAGTAALCDGVILVVEGGRTLRQAAQAAKALLVRAHCNVLGVFMNKRKFYIPQFLYERL